MTHTFKKLQRNNKLQINMTHTFKYGNLWKTCYHGRLLPASCETWHSHQHYRHLVRDTVQSGRKACFTVIFVSIRTWVEGSRFICNGAFLPDYTAQLTRRWSFIIIFNLKSLRSQTNVHKWPHGHSSSLGMVFCQCCLWRRWFLMVSHLSLCCEQHDSLTFRHRDLNPPVPRFLEQGFNFQCLLLEKKKIISYRLFLQM